MPSCIPGYEYDIFISYRQKDNRNDGWVTELVANLKKELEVTIKDEISVYFDENLHDGILDGHEVDDTVKAKLKCLIFIPIISQTYCDPDSFAWNKEFLAFREFAQGDKFGLKVRLPNGNVTSRILPVRIHELDPHDTKLLEKELAGPVRSIDFIYSAPGVNRPLRVREDHPDQNLNRTNYRDQINRVANLTKQIIASLKSPVIGQTETSGQQVIAPLEPRVVGRKRKLTFVLLLTFAAILSAYFLFDRIALHQSAERGPASIAVLPFKIIGGDDESGYLADGIQETVRANLCMFQELRVKSRTSVEQYRNSTKSIPEIGRELNVMYVLEGSAQRLGDRIRVVVQLIDTQSDIQVWSEQFNRKFEDVFTVQNQISEVIAQSLKAKLTPDIAERLYRTPTDNLEVYELFLRAQQASRKFTQSRSSRDLDLAIGYLDEAVKRDPQFAAAYGWLAGLIMIKEGERLFEPGMGHLIISLANRALAIDSTVVEAHIALSELHFVTHNDAEALRSTFKALENQTLDGASVRALMIRLGLIYSRVGLLDRGLVVFDELLRWEPSDEEVLYEKIIALAAGRNTAQLEGLKGRLKGSGSNQALEDMINLHLALEKKQGKEILGVYDRQSRLGNIQSDKFLPYSMIFAQALRNEGRGEESLRLAGWFEKNVTGSSYYTAQVLLSNGQIDQGLEQLNKESVGWYNLMLSQINPVFAPVGQREEFGAFLLSNTARLRATQSSIEQLEKKQQIPSPDFAITLVRTRGGLNI